MGGEGRGGGWRKARGDGGIPLRVHPVLWRVLGVSGGCGSFKRLWRKDF